MAKKATEPFPLTFHKASGQWKKKIKQRTVYFGRDKDEALAKWKAYEDDKNKPAWKTGDAPRLSELGNVYLDWCSRRIEIGKLSKRSKDDYQKSIGRLIEILGADCRVHALSPLDWARVETELYKPVERTTEIRGGVKGRTVSRRSIVTVSGDIRRIRAFLTWAKDSELIQHEPRYGREFRTASPEDLRKLKAKVGRRDIDAEAIRAIIGALSSPAMRAIAWIGINAGIGNRDLSEMQLQHLPKLTDGDDYVFLPRLKTGADRRFLLWPETKEAIKAYLKYRPGPAGSANRDRLFLTRVGDAFVRDGSDAIAKEFAKASKKAGHPSAKFYDLRRTWRTVADETLDIPAVMYIMGHAPQQNDMGSTYRQHIADERIKRVCEYVRTWLVEREAK